MATLRRTTLVQGPAGPPGPVPSPLTGSTSWTPGAISNGASANTTVTVSSAVLGQIAQASFSLALPAGMLLTAAVTATNTVVVTLANMSGSTQTLSSPGTLKVDVWTV